MVGLSSLRDTLGSTRKRGGRHPVGTWGADRLYRAMGSRGEPALAAVDLGSPWSACVVLRSEQVPLTATPPPWGSRGATSAPEAPRLASPVTSYPSPRRCSPPPAWGSDTLVLVPQLASILRGRQWWPRLVTRTHPALPSRLLTPLLCRGSWGGRVSSAAARIRVWPTSD